VRQCTDGGAASYAGAHCVYITDPGGRLTMNDVRDRIRAYRDVLEPTT
jgi:4-hydroxy 2-oxovalerate aldolase